MTIFYAFFAIKSCLKNFKNDDPQEIVIDEFVGQSIPVILYEFFHSDRNNSSMHTSIWLTLLHLTQLACQKVQKTNARF